MPWPATDAIFLIYLIFTTTLSFVDFRYDYRLEFAITNSLLIDAAAGDPKGALTIAA